MQKAQVSQPGQLKETTMKTLMLIPTLAVALVTASASLTAALACTPKGPGQCCTSPVFVEHGKYCQVTQCIGTAGGGLSRDKHCWFTNQPINDTPVPPIRPRPPSGGWNVTGHAVPGSSGATHQ
jgi:hypothetical protein